MLRMMFPDVLVVETLVPVLGSSKLNLNRRDWAGEEQARAAVAKQTRARRRAGRCVFRRAFRGDSSRARNDAE
jgi:hypothetical protein